MKMIAADIRAIEGDGSCFQIVDSQESIQIDEQFLPDEFWKTTVHREPDMELIKQILSQGKQIPGIQKTRTKALRITKGRKL